ncbi:MAG: glutamine--fructose-6-phosphate transaminase (isomerizing), partial [Eubacterium sp.]|nr:glutamine--fructose-6-phosphate transaminase (isomerizing) [Eubacterium sp.]
MCGIIGYTGYSEARGILLKGLKTLEYRGYDSAGIAVYHPDFNEVLVTKCEGRVEKLVEKSDVVKGTTGIGHTRWATHGGVSDNNSHPHKFGRVTLVHNGIVENYAAIKNQLGVANRLSSQTDSEVVAALIDAYYEGDPKEAIVKAVKELSGTFGLGIMFDDIPNKMFAVRNVSPIVCCQNEDGCYIASDIMAIGEYSEDYFVLPEFSVAEISPEGIVITDFNGNSVEPDMLKLDWDIKNSVKKGYPFYMEKEIMEQPEVIEKTIQNRIKDGMPDFSSDNVDDSIFSECDNITIIACGTAMHAGLIGKHIIEKYCKVPVTVNMASEYMYNDPIINDRTLVICVSQSGETIDTLEALKYARRKGARSLSIVNVKGSTIARESENVIYTNAGPEIAVASTKAYTTQVSVFYLIAAKMAYQRGLLNEYSTKHFIEQLSQIPSAVSDVLDRRLDVHKLSKGMLTAEHTFMIGRGLDYPTLLEASLKLKEISYIHSEAFASGELKHGTIALITNQTPVIALLSQDTLMSKQVSNIREVQSRGADVITFIKGSLKSKDVECSFELPSLEDDFMAIPSIIAM